MLRCIMIRFTKTRKCLTTKLSEGVAPARQVPGRHGLAYLAIAGFTVFGSMLPATAAILTPDRVVTWQGNVGIPGGIPNRTTIYTTIPAGSTGATIQNGLNSCP